MFKVFHLSNIRSYFIQNTIKQLSQIVNLIYFHDIFFASLFFIFSYKKYIYTKHSYIWYVIINGKLKVKFFEWKLKRNNFSSKDDVGGTYQCVCIYTRYIRTNREMNREIIIIKRRRVITTFNIRLLCKKDFCVCGRNFI